MSTEARRSSFSSSATSSLAKRPAAENAGKASAAAAPQQAKKRVALGNLTNNQGVAGRVGAGAARRPAAAAKGDNKSNAAPSSSSSSTARKASPSMRIRDTGLQKKTTGLSSEAVRARNAGLQKKPTIPSSLAPAKREAVFPNAAAASSIPGSYGGPASAAPIADHVPCKAVASPTHSRSSSSSSSRDESISTCHSMKSPEFEYVDNGDSAAVASLEQQAAENLRITEDRDVPGYAWKGDVPIPMDTSDGVIDVDSDDKNPQFCSEIACDIYKHLGLAERKHMPSHDYMERTQKDINASMRAILIDWLVEVAEEYRLVPDTLYLTVNYIDRYLSCKEMSRQRLQLLGVACMLIASKYEEICAPQVEEFCYITDNTYFKEEVLEMEAAVLKQLKFQMTAPTAKCFLRRFVRAAGAAAQGGGGAAEAPQLQLEFLANYAAELSLLEYDMLRFPPSVIAAASVFMARFMLQPSKMPWCSTMEHYTRYRAPDLCECVNALHQLLCGGGGGGSSGGSLPAVREKYSCHKYKFVAKKHCPPAIPPEFFFGDSTEHPKTAV